MIKLEIILNEMVHIYGWYLISHLHKWRVIKKLTKF
jgi:hypothetical protein